MFEVAWIPVLAGISGPLQQTDDMEIVELCLDGFKNAIRIVCFFDLELERNAFVTTLAKFTFLNNLGEMKAKNMEAIKALLDVAVNEGNNLKGSWHEVLSCVSQLEHMQLISSGVDVPDGRKGYGGLGCFFEISLSHSPGPFLSGKFANFPMKNWRMKADRRTLRLLQTWSFH